MENKGRCVRLKFYSLMLVYTQFTFISSENIVNITIQFTRTFSKPHKNCTFSRAPHLPTRHHQHYSSSNISPGHILGKHGLAKTKSVSPSYALKHCTYFRRKAFRIQRYVLYLLKTDSITLELTLHTSC